MILEPICLDAKDFSRKTKRESSDKISRFWQSHPGDVGFKKAAFLGDQ